MKIQIFKEDKKGRIKRHKQVSDKQDAIARCDSLNNEKDGYYYFWKIIK